MSLPTRKIGNDDVTEIGFGLMGLSYAYGSVLVDAAIEEGCTFWDTADMYGDNEEMLGKWLKRTGKRDQLFLATKFGFVLGKTGVVDARPECVKPAAELSMKKLGVEVIICTPDPKVPIEKTVGAMAELVKEGKVRYLGLSEVSGDTLRRAHTIHPIAAVQVEYSPFCLEIESEKVGLVKACKELGVTIIPYAPLGRGMLTGAYKTHDDIPEGDTRRLFPKFGRENFPNILKLVDDIQSVAKRHDVTSGQVTLTWIFAQGDNVIPIPGTKKIKYLKENLGAAKVKLSDEEVAEVREMAERASATLGPRYPPEWMALSFADTPPL